MINTLLIINNFFKLHKVDDALLLKINFFILFVYTIIIFVAQDFYLKVEYYINFFDLKITTNSNGISRILSIINIFITCNYFIKKRNMILLVLILTINFIVISMESRQGVVLILVQLLLIIFFCSQKNKLIKKSFKYSLLLIILPICLNFIYKNDLKNNRLYLFQGELSKIQSKSEDKNFTYINKITTGRLDQWKISSKYIINSQTRNLLFGNGPEFDRKILQAKGDDILQAKGNDVANGIIYIVLCGGVLGLLSFFIIIKKSLNIILNLYDHYLIFLKVVFL
jgi:hypothetical protein